MKVSRPGFVETSEFHYDPSDFGFPEQTASIADEAKPYRFEAELKPGKHELRFWFEGKSIRLMGKEKPFFRIDDVELRELKPLE
jgi:hypothetical protein